MDVAIDCICPPNAKGETRHPGGDTVTLRDVLDFRAGITVRKTIGLLKMEDDEVSAAEILAALTETYLLLGVEAWTVVDFRNKPVEVSKAAIREHLLTRMEVALVVADAADDLYLEATILPLLAKASTSSPPSPTDASTSAPTASPTPLRKRSKPSSTSTFQTDDTAETSVSLAGASNS